MSNWQEFYRPARNKTAFFATVFLCVLVLFSLNAALALDKERPDRFLPEERRVIEAYYHKAGPSKGLPPGLAKKNKLPPGLQKHLDRTGRLPPGLQKRLEPLPPDLEARLPRIPEYWERVILERDVILMDRRTQRILDIIEDIVGVATGR